MARDSIEKQMFCSAPPFAAGQDRVRNCLIHISRNGFSNYNRAGILRTLVKV